MERTWYIQLLELYKQFPDNEQNLELEEKIVEIEKDKNYRVFMREWGGKLVASLTAIILHNLTGRGRDYMVVDNVITHSDFQRMGFAKNLFQEAEQWAKERDCYKIIVVSNKKFESAQKFYLNQGYEFESSNVFIKHL